MRGSRLEWRDLGEQATPGLLALLGAAIGGLYRRWLDRRRWLHDSIARHDEMLIRIEEKLDAVETHLGRLEDRMNAGH